MRPPFAARAALCSCLALARASAQDAPASTPEAALASLRELGAVVEVTAPPGGASSVSVECRDAWRGGDDGLRHLARLANLRALTLSRSPRVTGAGLVHVGSLDKLEILNLELLEISDADLKPLRGLEHLRFLHLSNLKNVTAGGLSFLEGLHALRDLSLGQLPRVVGEGLARSARLPDLESLSIFHVDLGRNGLGFLAGSKRLARLDIWSCGVHGAALEPLAELPALRSLSLSGGKVTDGDLKVLVRASGLTFLDLTGAKVGDSGLPLLGGLARLERLVLEDVKVTGRGFKGLELPRLKDLSLRATDVDDDGLAHLAGFPSLEKLDLEESRVTDAGLHHLRAHARLAVLHLHGRERIGDRGMADVAALAGLHVLTLRNTGVTDAGLATLAPLKELRELSVRKTQVTDEGMKTLREHPKLEVLNLEFTTVGDDGLRSLAGLKCLREVRAHRARISGAAAQALEKAIPGLRVQLED